MPTSPVDAAVTFEPGKWREVSTISSAEPGVQYVVVHIQHDAGGTLDIDAVELTLLQEPAANQPKPARRKSS